MTDNFLLKYRIKHTLHGSLYILDRIVNNLVQTDIYTLIVCGNFCNRVRTDIKSDDDRIGCGSKNNIRFVDCADTTMDHFYNHFFIGQFHK